MGRTRSAGSALRGLVLLAVVCSALGAIVDTAVTDSKLLDKVDVKDSIRQQRFFSSVKLHADSENDLDSSLTASEKIDGEDPNTALDGVYSECLMNLSFPCLQRKLLVFLDRLGRMTRFNLIGNFLSVVRTAKESRPLLTEDNLIARKMDDEKSLKDMIDDSIDQFFDDHVIRVNLPQDLVDGSRSSNVLDFKVGEETSVEEGRKKKKGGGGGKMKGMKKMMMMGCMMMMGKAMMLGPIIMGIAGLAAMKALIFGTMALTISKIMILKKLKMMMDKGGSGWSSGGSGGGSSGGWSSGGGGGGGGWSSGGGGGGGGGWSSGGGSDRSYDAHSIAYRGYR